MEVKTLFQIKVEDISPNPHNPRMIFDPHELEELKKSIAKVGILVPITVFKNTKNFPKTKYVLLDGERRWKCTKELGLVTIPANVIDEPKDITQNILFMFNIHHYRREWELLPTALKLEVVMESLATDQERVLSEFTGVKRTTIRRCKMLLWYPNKYRDILASKDGKISTDFFIELYPIVHRLSQEEEFNFPKGTERLVDALIEKFLAQKIMSDVKEFREIRKTMGYYDRLGDFEKFKTLIKQFIEEENIGLEIFVTKEIQADKLYQNVIKYISFLNANIQQLSPDMASDLSFITQLTSLYENVKLFLERIE